MKTMKTKLAVTVVLAAALAPALTAMAQYKPTGEDGITASPRVRKMLAEHCACAPATATATADLARPQSDGLAASPKLRSLVAQHSATAPGSPASEVSTTRPVNDGLAASPKVRELLRGWSVRTAVELAPLSR